MSSGSKPSGRLLGGWWLLTGEHSLAAPRERHLGRPAVVIAAFVRALITVLTILNLQVAAPYKKVEAHYGLPYRQEPLIE
ncbi:hypothetical protein SAMN05444920_13826 [Nonomuraea solani]|uniref:Uncharacterized protein n=1 Tax=Nonomuraea solani TaxID=1144553 RepID=A0A1H6F1P9_9ACTN|nr:hypothetical protein [Nonomuraea solani]SEH03523.1 hypothetical protein SAMN05444920_13826 [Nonomuraea solani]